jgi:polyphosphate kinase
MIDENNQDSVVKIGAPFNDTAPIIGQLSEKDQLLTFPYHSFSTMVDLLREAAIDPTVDRIRMTLYRAAPRSQIVGALLAACRSGKEITVIVELKARFDEEANIALAQKLSEEGARVVYGLEGFKIHAKLCLIERRVDGKRRRIACVGTGNFNEITAGRYIDQMVITSDRRITGEVADLFDYLEEPYRVSSFDHLLVSPFQMRKKIIKLITREIAMMKTGSGFIDIRCNNITDEEISLKLIEAARAGVRVRLLVRGMCIINPDPSIPITARRVVDSFLEHSRVFIFGNGGEPKVYLSSADLMSRNLDRRVEVALPVYDRNSIRELIDCFELSWRDDRKGIPIGLPVDRWIPNRNGLRSQYEIGRYLENSCRILAPGSE